LTASGKTWPTRLGAVAPTVHAVVDLQLVDQDVRVDVRGRGEVTLADELADPRPQHP
jgi:hypothetical protein